MIKSNWAREKRIKAIKEHKIQSKIEKEKELAIEQAEMDAQQREEDAIIAHKKATQEKKDKRMQEKMALVQKNKLANLAISLAGTNSLMEDAKRT